MRSSTLLGISLATLLAACTAPDNGYYDVNGNYIPPANATTDAQMYKAPNPGASRGDHIHYRGDTGNHVHVTPVAYEAPPVQKTVTTTTYTYDRPGYYDYNGYYVTEVSGLTAPDDMLPPRGLCRVWFPNRTVENQPRVEPCDNITARGPAGAYVIYGG